jgi:hypothetical protein
MRATAPTSSLTCRRRRSRAGRNDVARVAPCAVTGHVWSARKPEFLECVQRDSTSPVPLRKIFRFGADPNQQYIHCRPASFEGRFAIVTKRWARDAVDAAVSKDERQGCGRRSRGVLIPRRWHQVRGKFRGRRRQRSSALREDHEGNRKTIARGMPGVFRCDRGDYACVLFHFAHKAAGATGARHSLRPLILEEG